MSRRRGLSALFGTTLPGRGTPQWLEPCRDRLRLDPSLEESGLHLAGLGDTEGFLIPRASSLSHVRFSSPLSDKSEVQQTKTPSAPSRPLTVAQLSPKLEERAEAVVV